MEDRGRAAPERRRVSDVDRRLEKQREKAARALARWSEGAARRPLAVDLERAKVKTCEMMESGDWSEAGPIHFLMLHRQQHAIVYGSTLVVSKKSLFIIADVVKTWFDGDAQEFARYMHWVWEKEAARVERLRSHDVQLQWGFTVRRLAHEDLITGYRTYVANADRDHEEDD